MPIPMVDFGDVSRAIQLALAPVFLLTGIAGVLNVMTGRVARIIDRRQRQVALRARAAAPTATRPAPVQCPHSTGASTGR